MRTTINIDTGLLMQAKLRAKESNITLSSVIEHALRVSFADRVTLAKKRVSSMPTSGSGGLQPGVDLDNNSSLLERMTE